MPEARGLSPEEWRAFGDVVEHALAARPAAVRRQLGLFILILNLMALVHHGRPLRGLAPERRARFLADVENSRLLLFRRGFWGIRTLVFMGYYARPASAAALGYAAAPRGWELRR